MGYYENVFDELGYQIYEDVLDAKEYGIPQTRRRVYVVGIREVAKEKGDRTKLSNCFQDIIRLNLLATSIV